MEYIMLYWIALQYSGAWLFYNQVNYNNLANFFSKLKVHIYDKQTTVLSNL